jgi:hypothetical protein
MPGSISLSQSLRAFVRSYRSFVVEGYYRRIIKKLPPGTNTAVNTGLDPHVRPLPVVVTLSTIAKHLDHKVDLAIASLLTQKFRPDRVILWLSDTLENQPLPENFRYLQKAGLEVQYRKDVGPQTKLLYALQEYPDCLVVSADDDMFYPSNWLSDLYASYQPAPHYIHCHRAHLMRKDEHGKLLPYQRWNWLSPGVLGPSHWLFATGVGGILYPPNSLSPEVFNVEAFRQLCPLADDVWFKAMALLQDTPVKKVAPYAQQPLVIRGSQEERLTVPNITRNDLQLQATFDAYDLYHLLREEV